MAEQDLTFAIKAIDEASAQLKAVEASVRALTPAHQAASDAADLHVSKLSAFDNVIRAMMGGPLMQFRGQLGLVNEVFTAGHEAAVAGAEGLSGFNVALAIGGAAAAAGVAALGAVAFEITKMGMEAEVTRVHLQNMGDIGVEEAHRIQESMTTLGGVFTGAQLTGALSNVAGRLELVSGKALDVKDSLDVMGAAEMLAMASGQSLESSTNAIVSQLGVYGMRLDQSKEAAAELYNVSRATGLGLDELAATTARINARLGVATPSMAQFGAVVEELAAKSGGSSRALMNFAHIMEQLDGTNKQSMDTMKLLGVTIFDEHGQFVGLDETITRLSGALAGLDPKHRQMAESMLVGSQAAGFLDIMLTKGRDTLDKLTKANQDTEKAQRDATAAGDTAQAHIDEFKAHLSDMAEEIGGPVAKHLVELGNWFGWVGNRADDAGAAITRMLHWQGQTPDMPMMGQSEHATQDQLASMKKLLDAGAWWNKTAATEVPTEVPESVSKTAAEIARLQKLLDALAAGGGGAAAAKTALQELGVSADVLRKSLETLHTPEAEIEADLIAMGVRADEAGPKIFGLNLTVMQLDEALVHMGYSAQIALDMANKVAEVQAAEQAFAEGAKARNEAEQAARQAADETKRILEASMDEATRIVQDGGTRLMDTLERVLRPGAAFGASLARGVNAWLKDTLLAEATAHLASTAGREAYASFLGGGDPKAALMGHQAELDALARLRRTPASQIGNLSAADRGLLLGPGLSADVGRGGAVTNITIAPGAVVVHGNAGPDTAKDIAQQIAEIINQLVTSQQRTGLGANNYMPGVV